MRTHTLNIQLNPMSRLPLVLQIVEALKEAILDGRIYPGEALPSIRVLSQTLGVNRNTVADAYMELTAEGLLEGRVGSGSFVKGQPMGGGAGAKGGEALEVVAFPFKDGAIGTKRHVAPISCRTGKADPRLLPAMALARAYRRSLESGSRIAEFGARKTFKSQVLELLHKTLGITGDASNLAFTSGMHAAVRLIASVLIEPGDVVAVEELGSRSYWSVFTEAHARLMPISVDKDGMCVEELIMLSQHTPIRAVWVTPRCQYPTTCMLSPARRAKLLFWAKTHGVAVIECDSDGGMYFDPLPAPVLAAEDRQGSTIYIGSFAKALYPGLPLAYIHAPSPLISALEASHAMRDQASDPIFESSMSHLFVEGELYRHLGRLRTVLMERRAFLAGAFRSHFGARVEFEEPRYGMAFWLRVSKDVDVDEWHARSIKNGVSFAPGRAYTFDGSACQAIRIGFSTHQEDELEEIVKIMTNSLL